MAPGFTWLGSGATIGGIATGTGNIIAGKLERRGRRRCAVPGRGQRNRHQYGGERRRCEWHRDLRGWSGATIGGTGTSAGNTISDNSQAGIDVTSGGTANITDDAITGNATGILVGSGRPIPVW